MAEGTKASDAQRTDLASPRETVNGSTRRSAAPVNPLSMYIFYLACKKFQDATKALLFMLRTKTPLWSAIHCSSQVSVESVFE